MIAMLSAVDWAVIGVYLAGIFLVSLYSSGKQESTRDYFIGGRSLPWWAVTLSIIATETSVATYIGTPELAYLTDWYYLQIVAGFVLGRIFLAYFFIRIFYRFEILTVYGFLEKRFGNGCRVMAALFFLAGRSLGSGVRLCAACLAVKVATGLPLGWSLLIFGILGILYTLFGGIKAVVWAECILGLTFIAGGVIAIVYLLHQIEGGWSAIASHPAFYEKFKILHWGPLDAPGATEKGWFHYLASDQPLAIGLLGGFVLTMATHGIDQDIVQRMLACSDERRGGRSLLGSAAILLPMIAIFLTVGSLLWFFHQLYPGTQPPVEVETIYYFPLFIVRHLPAGIAGLVFAGLFATALSSHTSVLNALAATTLADLYRPFLWREASEEHYLKASRWFTALWGLLLMAVAWAFFDSQKNILLLAQGVLTYFYGSLLGVFLLGIFTRRGSSWSAMAGMIAAVPCVFLLQLREFLAKPESAPVVVRLWMDKQMPAGWAEAVLTYVPRVAWPLWVVVGTAVALGIGALGNQSIAMISSRSPRSDDPARRSAS